MIGGEEGYGFKPCMRHISGTGSTALVVRKASLKRQSNEIKFLFVRCQWLEKNTFNIPLKEFQIS